MKTIKFIHSILFIAIIVIINGCTDYDHDTPDTKPNRSGFERHIGFKPSADVKNLYYYADEFCSDVRYQLGFECSEKTKDKIIAQLGLISISDSNTSLDPRDDLTWWNNVNVLKLLCWMKRDKSKEYFRYFWYDSDAKKAYYHEYSI